MSRVFWLQFSSSMSKKNKKKWRKTRKGARKEEKNFPFFFCSFIVVFTSVISIRKIVSDIMRHTYTHTQNETTLIDIEKETKVKTMNWAEMYPQKFIHFSVSSSFLFSYYLYIFMWNLRKKIVVMNFYSNEFDENWIIKRDSLIFFPRFLPPHWVWWVYVCVCICLRESSWFNHIEQKLSIEVINFYFPNNYNFTTSIL